MSEDKKIGLKEPMSKERHKEIKVKEEIAVGLLTRVGQCLLVCVMMCVNVAAATYSDTDSTIIGWRKKRVIARSYELLITMKCGFEEVRCQLRIIQFRIWCRVKGFKFGESPSEVFRRPHVRVI